MQVSELSIKISIVICSYNRADFLESVLNTLTHQTIGYKFFEVIVINNNSTDDTQTVAEDYTLKHDTFRVVFEKKQGLSHARNRGYKEAKGDWVAYLDDDAKASNNYVERMLHVIKHYDFDCFGGVYLPWYKYGKPKWFKDEYGSNGFKLKKTGILDEDYASGGVIVFKKSVLEYFNGFPVNIGMSGTKVAYGEEVFLQIKMKQKGYVIGFDPNLRIEHVVARKKLKISWFLRSSFAKGRDSLTTYGIKMDSMKVIRVLIWSLYFFSLNLCRYPLRLLEPNYYIQNLIIDLFRPFARSWGQIIGAMAKE